MKKIVGILLLFIFIRSRIIVQSDLMGETLDDGDRVVENTHTYSCPSFPEDNGAKWIWGPNFNSVPDGEVRIFRQNFRLNCDSTLTLFATADSQFKAYINGVMVLQGDNYVSTYSAQINTEKASFYACKVNELKFQVTGNYGRTTTGLIYQLLQQQDCLNCPPGLQFNPRICQCDCQQSCSCHEPQVWHVAPDCRCGCPKILCESGKYLDQDSCSCKCIPQNCSYDEKWDDCHCKCISKESNI